MDNFTDILLEDSSPLRHYTMSLGYDLHWSEGLQCLQSQIKFLLRLLVLEDEGDVIVHNIRNIIPTTQCHIPEDLNL